VNSVGANTRGVSVRRFRVSRASADGLNFFVRLVQAGDPVLSVLHPALQAVKRGSILPFRTVSHFSITSIVVVDRTSSISISQRPQACPTSI